MSESDQDLGRVIDVLRTPVEVRPAWRDALLHEIGALPAPVRSIDAAETLRRRTRVWSVRPALALAASVVLFCGGIWLGAVLTRRVDTRAQAVLPAQSGGDSRSFVTVRFLLVARQANRVSLVGDFNRWNPVATPMRRAIDGQSWIVEVPLTPGRHIYAFVVDGDVVTDPAAPVATEDDFGVPNSVVLVSGGGT